MDTPGKEIDLKGAAKKIPPVGWAGIILGGVAIGLFLRLKKGKTATATVAASTDNSSAIPVGYQGVGNLGATANGGGSSSGSTPTPMGTDFHGINLPVQQYAILDPISGQTVLTDGNGNFISILDDPAVASAVGKANTATTAAQNQLGILTGQKAASDAAAAAAEARATAAESRASAPAPAPVASSALPGINLAFHPGDTYAAVSKALLANNGIVMSPDQIRGITNGPAKGPVAGSSISIDGSRFATLNGKQTFTG